MAPFSPKVTLRLMRALECNPYPDVSEIEQLILETGLTKRQVMTWFSNHRHSIFFSMTTRQKSSAMRMALDHQYTAKTTRQELTQDRPPLPKSHLNVSRHQSTSKRTVNANQHRSTVNLASKSEHTIRKYSLLKPRVPVEKQSTKEDDQMKCSGDVQEIEIECTPYQNCDVESDVITQDDQSFTSANTQVLSEACFNLDKNQQNVSTPSEMPLSSVHLEELFTRIATHIEQTTAESKRVLERDLSLVKLEMADLRNRLENINLCCSGNTTANSSTIRNQPLILGQMPPQFKSQPFSLIPCYLAMTCSPPTSTPSTSAK